MPLTAADTNELISCIMVTRNRPRFVRQSLRYFTRQTYANAELLVVDDGEQSVEDECAGLDRVRYIRVDRPTSTGSKLNLGIEQAYGDLLQKLDDDDYYHPDFLQVAARHMPAENRDHVLAAWDCFVMWIVGETHLRYSGHGWTIGNTLLFSRKFWQKAPFRDLARGSDRHFLRDHEGKLIRICAPEHCMVVRHGANTWTDMRSGQATDAFLRRFPVYPKRLSEIVGADNMPFYETLGFTETTMML